jgi:predicted DNA-binding transcriptional regulator AlpA
MQPVAVPTTFDTDARGAPRANGPKRLITGPRLRDRLGISAPTLWRWLRNEALGFPKPMVINGRLFFEEDQVTAWLESRSA